jgi:hypothetical protein
MEVTVEASKDAEHYVRGLRAFRRRHRGLKGVFWWGRLGITT